MEFSLEMFWEDITYLINKIYVFLLSLFAGDDEDVTTE